MDRGSRQAPKLRELLEAWRAAERRLAGSLTGPEHASATEAVVQAREAYRRAQDLAAAQADDPGEARESLTASVGGGA